MIRGRSVADALREPPVAKCRLIVPHGKSSLDGEVAGLSSEQDRPRWTRILRRDFLRTRKSCHGLTNLLQNMTFCLGDIRRLILDATEPAQGHLPDLFPFLALKFGAFCDGKCFCVFLTNETSELSISPVMVLDTPRRVSAVSSRHLDNLEFE